MAQGHIKLGSVGSTRRPYLLHGGPKGGRKRYLPDPHAEKLSSGPRKYTDDLQWDYWTMQDWQGGIGQTDPEQGGFLFAELDSRVPNQLILPPYLHQSDEREVNNTYKDCRYMPSGFAGTVTVGVDGVDKLAVPFFVDYGDSSSADYLPAYFWCTADYEAEVKIAVLNASTQAEIASTTTTQDDQNGNFLWLGGQIDASASSLADQTAYWLSIEVTNSKNVRVGYDTSGYDQALRTYDGSTWTTDTGKYAIYTTGLYHPAGTGSLSAGQYPVVGAFFRRFNDNLYYIHTTNIYKYSENTNTWALVTNFSNGVNSLCTDVEVFGPYLWFASQDSGGTGYLHRMNLSETVANQSLSCTLLLEHNGLLWRAYENDAYYYDGSTWSSAIPVGGDSAEIRGMAGLDEDIYCSTDKGLYRIGRGDFVYEVLRWGAESSDNGLGMIAYQGALYIPVNGRLLRYTTDGQLLDVWVSREGDLPRVRIGRIEGLAVMNNWLVAQVNADATYPKPMVLVWQTTGWHALTSLPMEANAFETYTNLDVYYDRGTSKLWISTSSLGPMYVDVPDYAINPFSLTTYTYALSGWFETDWFDGRIIERIKDFESVTIFGENISNQTNILVYWQDDDSTTWEALGTVLSNVQELRWSDYAQRPATKRFKLAFRPVTLDNTETPKIDAVVVKFLANIRDRYAWHLAIQVAEDLGGVDGEIVQSYTAAQQQAHLDALEKQAMPFILEDIDGILYEVRVTQAYQDVVDWENLDDDSSVTAVVYNWTLEQATEGTYSE